MSATYQIGSLENNQKNININEKPYSTFVTLSTNLLSYLTNTYCPKTI